FAVMVDKAWAVMLDRLLGRAAEVVVTRVGRRGLDPHMLADTIGDRRPVHVVGDPRTAVRTGVERASDRDAVLIPGSPFLAADASAEVGSSALFEPWQG